VRRQGIRLAIPPMIAVTVMAFSAVAAASASAFSWGTKVAGATTNFTNGQTETVTPSIKPETVLRFVWTSGSTPVEMTATTLTSPNWKINQNGGAAESSGKLVFKGLKVVTPTTCVAPAVLETTELRSEVVGSVGLPSQLADRFTPASGELVASFKLGGTCAWAGTSLQLETSAGFYAERNSLGTFGVTQPLTFSPSIDETAGGNLFLGTNAFTLRGELTNTLSGPLIGKEWAAR
jgi:hypothetical protein